MPDSSCVQRWEELLAREGVNPGNRRRDAEQTFRNVDLAGKSMLEIGAGAGWLSFYAACAGASAVVAIEPEAAGSTAGSRRKFEQNAATLGLDNVVLESVTLQEFEPRDRTFDIVLSYASINHLDEEACMRLHEDDDARRTYRALVAKIAGVTKPGGAIVVCDCARANVFPRLGLGNPIVPTIEWEKHQSPRLWIELLTEGGFTDPRVRWRTFNTLRAPGRALLGNRLGAYLTFSGFCLTMEYQGRP